MTSGPLPDEAARRRNPPTIPTTKLPATGRKGRPPKCPYELKAAGEKWWKWAWGTPQAAAWDPGALYSLARRAQLEDDLATINLVDRFDLGELLEVDEENEVVRRLEFVIGHLKRMAGGELAVMKEMRELDAKHGLTPESLAKLRWKIVDEKAQQSGAQQSKPPAAGGTARGRARLRAV